MDKKYVTLVTVLVLALAVAWLYRNSSPAQETFVNTPLTLEKALEMRKALESIDPNSKTYGRTNGYYSQGNCERRNGSPDKPGGSRGMKSPIGELVTGCELGTKWWYPKCGTGYKVMDDQTAMCDPV